MPCACWHGLMQNQSSRRTNERANDASRSGIGCGRGGRMKSERARRMILKNAIPVDAACARVDAGTRRPKRPRFSPAAEAGVAVVAALRGSEAFVRRPGRRSTDTPWLESASRAGSQACRYEVSLRTIIVEAAPQLPAQPSGQEDGEAICICQEVCDFYTRYTWSQSSFWCGRPDLWRTLPTMAECLDFREKGSDRPPLPLLELASGQEERR
ncbi:hypothetical protein GY45DRAFT_762433 [Cubamyces sp. BRFM 1775]|nr:hypothetical protein GY45DRAFT_762433 [Cubamyces sp. BRFM 1775]